MNHHGVMSQQGGLGLPPPSSQHHSHLQDPRSSGYLQHHRSHSPHQPPHSALHAPQQGSYAPSHSSGHNISQHSQSNYIASASGLPSQHTGETPFYGTGPSAYSTNAGSVSYASSEPSEGMAAQAAMSRPSYSASIANYQAPQSTSPTSIHSPQTDSQGRPLYGLASMTQPMYYSHYPMQQQQQQQHPQQQSPYTHHSQTSHHPPIASNQSVLLSRTPNQQHPLSQPPTQTQHATAPTQSQPVGVLDSKHSPTSVTRPPSVTEGQQGGPQTPSGPGMKSAWPISQTLTDDAVAPGPIPATTPLVVRQDGNGVQWIAFEYSRDRVKMEYTIRCDVESVDVDSLPQDFKTSNCVYPRACVGKDQYKGNRHHYETECNTVGWALAQLNPTLRDKRGLIQRAVDSWRNSNQDPRLRSRRVRRMAKLNNRKQSHPQPMPSIGNHPGLPSAGLQPPQGMAPTLRAPSHLGPAPQSIHPHHNGHVSDEVGGMFHHM